MKIFTSILLIFVCAVLIWIYIPVPDAYFFSALCGVLLYYFRGRLL